GHRHRLPVVPAEAQHLPLARRRRHLDPTDRPHRAPADPPLEDELLAVLGDLRRACVGRAPVRLAAGHRAGAALGAAPAAPAASTTISAATARAARRPRRPWCAGAQVESTTRFSLVE